MTRLLPNSITARTSALFTGLAALVFAAMGLIIQASVNHHFVEQDRAVIFGKLELVSHILQGASASTDVTRIKGQLASALVGHHDLVIRVQNSVGDDVFTSGHEQLADAAMATAKPMPTLVPWTDKAASYRLVATDIYAPDGALLWRVGIAINSQHHTQFLATFEREILLIGASGLAFMALFGWVAIRRGLKPLQRMAMVAEGISAEHLTGRLVTEQVPTELTSLTRAFNAMLDRLSDSLSRLAAFSSDLAHELRTPVNNLMTQTQVVLSKPRTSDDYQETLYSNLEEFERLARMISDMLFLAKADNGLIIPHREAVHLAREVSAVFEFYDALAAERNLTLQLSGSAEVSGDALMLRRVISNLVSNAVRHAAVDSVIAVEVSATAGVAQLAIENTGETIAEQHLPHVFERFYRVNSSRQRSEEGAGLGLAITKSIIEAHKGSIGVVSDAGLTRFTVTLPI
ncbi:MAG: heavy metal sensor histidine kinase [Paraperlucidibaca sp.]